MLTVLLSISFVGLAIALLSIRIIFLKKGEFKGTCATQSPFLKNKGIVCSTCGKVLDEDMVCEKEALPQPSLNGSELRKKNT